MPGDKRVPLPKRAPSPWLPVGSALILLVLVAIVIPSPTLALELWVVCIIGGILVALSLRARRAALSNPPTPPAPSASHVPAAQSAPAAVSASPSAPATPGSHAGCAGPTQVAIASNAPVAGRGAGWGVLTEAEAAELLRVDEETIITAIESGEVPGNRVGVHWRIRTESLLTWLDGIYEPPRAAPTARGVQPPGAGGEG